eukprot:comp59264_c0_seq1/m.47848 comp59264_c0_seq1/g.47848  ORF comp59264_c0_seq1/g.47848 comp59264_c0_seq1/m.47848 type:complete len:191 (-) comp59264_c0_seq1:45-617(-)
MDGENSALRLLIPGVAATTLVCWGLFREYPSSPSSSEDKKSSEHAQDANTEATLTFPKPFSLASTVLHAGVVSFLGAGYVAGVYSPQHWDSIKHLRRAGLFLAATTGTACVLRTVLEWKRGLKVTLKPEDRKRASASRGYHVLMFLPLVCAEFVVDTEDPSPAVMWGSAAVVVASCVTGTILSKTGVKKD